MGQGGIEGVEETGGEGEFTDAEGGDGLAEVTELGTDFAETFLGGIGGALGGTGGLLSGGAKGFEGLGGVTDAAAFEGLDGGFEGGDRGGIEVEGEGFQLGDPGAGIPDAIGEGLIQIGTDARELGDLAGEGFVAGLEFGVETAFGGFVDGGLDAINALAEVGDGIVELEQAGFFGCELGAEFGEA